MKACGYGPIGRSQGPIVSKLAKCLIKMLKVHKSYEIRMLKRKAPQIFVLNVK